MNFFTELKRRNVFRVAAAYIVASWLVIEVSSVVMPVFGAPEWVLKLLMVFITVGLVIALMLSWLFEITPEGIKLEADVDRSQSITSETAKKLDRMTIALVVVGLVVLGVDRLIPEQAAPVVETGPAKVEEVVQADTGTEASEKSQVASNSIAVLPFANMSTDRENEFFADGIAEELLNLLAGVEALEVASRTSAFAFKGTSSSIPEIAEQLKVRYVLEGSVRKAGGQVRITAQLIDATTDRHLWSDTYDRTLSDIFAIQDEIAAAIGQALQVKLLGTGGQTVSSDAVDPAMYETFLEARFLLRRRSIESLHQAVASLREVVAKEPEHARSKALLAEALLLTQGEATEAEDRRLEAEAESLARQAMEMAPNLATPYIILGSIAQTQSRDLTTTHDYYLKAIELEPSEPRPHHWLSNLYGEAGYLDRGMKQINLAIQLEPGNANAWGWRVAVLAAAGKFDEAVADSLQQAKLGNPSDAYFQAAMIEILRGDLKSAENYLSQRPNEDPAYWEKVSGLLFAAANRPGRPIELLEVLNLRLENETYFTPYILAALGADSDYLEHMGKGRSNIHWIVWSQQRRSLRQNPGFVPMLKTLGYLELWRELGPPPDCRAEGDTFTCGHGYPEGYVQ